MKRKLLLLLTAIAFVANAKPVDPATLNLVASRFYGPVAPAGLRVQPIGSEMVLYGWEGGFVLLAADDCVRPVLAYSRTNGFSLDAMPANLAGWIESYRLDIAGKVAAGLGQSEAVAAEWARCTGGLAPKTTYEPVPPLMTTTWNQRPGYNALCPYDEADSALCVTGCTATAMAQVMKYWNHPEVGWGSESYQFGTYGTLSAQFDTTHYRWNLMPDALTPVSDSASIMAVAELMYHVGVAVHMRYSTTGSGAHVINYGYSGYPSAETALKTHFGYSPLLTGVMRENYTDTEWDAMLRAELDAQRPVLYAGNDPSGGHAFVFDGYDSLGYFHVNWGWGGFADGYFTIDSLSPNVGGDGGNDTYTFNDGNLAVIGIEPVYVSAGGTAVVDMRFDPAMGHVEGNGTYTAGSDVVTITAHAAEGHIFTHWASGSTTNALEFLILGDVSDSAIFQPLPVSDTIGYCTNSLWSAWSDDYSDTTAWAIRIPASMRHASRGVKGVQIYIYNSDTYTFHLLVGDSIATAQELHSESEFFVDAQEWNYFAFDSVVPVPDDATLWLAVYHCIHGGYPATYSNYRGNSDASWYRHPDGWKPYIEEGIRASWMLRAVMEQVETVPADPTGIDAPVAEPLQVSVCGRRVECSATDALYFDALGRQVGAGPVADMPAAGVYVVRAGQAAQKIVVK